MSSPSTHADSSMADGGDRDTPNGIDWEARIKRALSAQNDEGSHVEEDPAVFHPSQLARCKRQAVLGKYGLADHDAETLGRFKLGTLVHEWLEESFEDTLHSVHHEIDVQEQYTVQRPAGPAEAPDEVTVVGTADVYDAVNGVVYDFKTRSNWYKFNPPTQRHVDQLLLYMDALDAKAGQVVYISKKDLEVRTWPEDGTFAFDPGRHQDLLAKAGEIRDALVANGQPETPAEIPFDHCGCWICDQEAEA